MANLWKGVFLFCASIYLVLAKHEKYDGHAFYAVSVSNAQEAQFVNSLENQIPIDVFEYATPERSGQILVPGNVRGRFERLLSAKNIYYNIETENIRESLEFEEQQLNAAFARSNRSSIDFNQIPRFQAVDDYLVGLAAAYPNLVSVASAGRSFQGRDMKYLKISSSNFQDARKPVVFIMSLLHAREWITLPASLYAIEKLVVDVQERDLIDSIDWIILPIANPDGYEFTHTNTRFWRKNRANGYAIGNICLGVDLNRNFASSWGTASSNNVCSDTFHGRGAFSEPETQNIRDILQANLNRIALYIDLHSFGSMILYAYGNGSLPHNVLALNVNAVAQAQAIDRVKVPQRRNYVVGNIVNVIGYAASGGSSDYAQAIDIPFAYTYEMPAHQATTTGLNGFLVDPAFIRQAGMETWEGIKTGARMARDLF